MGVPSFYKWLVDKYPNAVVPVREAKGNEIDTRDPNPNGIEFDNLYLDMNGIIHPCFHPDDREPPTTFDEVFQNIFEYIDWLFKLVRPRKLLFLAIDGVAPRAKMNQQRSRRFRTAKDAEIAEAEEERLRKEFEREGKKVLPKQKLEVSDSNVITPGTEFMEKLSNALEVYICLRLKSDIGWKSIKVILSDANSPGEGEHKIMKFIRLQRNHDGYNPNTRHCLYGLDADLIMLALATHEIHFTILREDVIMEQTRGSMGRPLQSCLSNVTSASSPLSEECSNKWKPTNVSRKPYQKPYQFLNIWTVREYLALELEISSPPFKIDFERIIDDFVFICFFTGNDFLPHMPSLEIREGAIDLLMDVYKDEFKTHGDYLVNTHKLEEKAGYLNLKQIEKFILSIGTYEERIFKKRMNMSQSMKKRIMQQMAKEMDDLEIKEEDPFIQFPVKDLVLNGRHEHCKVPTVNTSKSDSTSRGMCAIIENEVLKNTEELKRRVKEVIHQKSDLFKLGGLEKDTIQLGMPGWKERYYKEKFSAQSGREIESIRKEIVGKYTEGLCWVLQYYYFGVGSWNWFYPYHYGPFASDLKGLGGVNVSFNMGVPFKPFDQLMGVLPPRSIYALPKAYWHLVTEEQSNLIDFYPTDFDVDIDGKRFLWQGIVKLPFIEEKRLLAETSKLENELEEYEINRNSESREKIFVSSSHDFASQIVSLYEQNATKKEIFASGDMNGFIAPSSEYSGYDTSSVKQAESATKNDVLCATYEFPISNTHIPRLLENVTIPEKTLTETDNVKRPLWHEYEGHRPPNYNSLQNQERYRKVINGGNVASPDAMSVKEAGHAWRGRGRGNIEAIHSTHNRSHRGIGAANNVSEIGKWGRGRGKTLESQWNRTPDLRRRIQSLHGSPAASGYGRGNGAANNMRPMTSYSSSFEIGKWGRGGEMDDIQSSWNQTSDSCRRVNPSLAHAKDMGSSWSRISDSGQMRALSGTPVASTNNVPVRGKEYMVLWRDQTPESNRIVHAPNVGKVASPSAGGWAGAGANQGLGRGRGVPIVHTPNVGKVASPSARGWAGAGANQGLGRGRGVPERTWLAKNSSWASRNATKNDSNFAWQCD